MADKKLVTLDLLQKYHNTLMTGKIASIESAVSDGTGITNGSITKAKLSAAVQASLDKADASASNADLTTEINRAKAAEKANADAITALNGTGTGSVDAKILVETNRAKAAEKANADAITNLVQATGVSSLATGAKSLASRLDTLEGTGEGSVAYKIAAIVNENNNGKIDTLNEIAAWIINDSTGAAKMGSDITGLRTDVTALQNALGTDGTGKPNAVTRITTLETKLAALLGDDTVTMATTDDIDKIFTPAQS